MNNLDDMKLLWHTATTNQLPSSTEMLKLIRKFRRQKLRNKWLVIVSCLLISCLVVAALFVAQQHMLSTYIGAMLLVIASLWLATTNIRSLKRFYQLEENDNVKFLEFIAKTRENQLYYYQKTMVVIMLLSVLGCMLYSYELVCNAPIVGIVTYVITTIYFALIWFIVRPRRFKKDQEKLTATKARVENILNQLK